MTLPPPSITWVDQVRGHAQARPDATALRFEGTTTTWDQLRRRVDHLAMSLIAAGVASGDGWRS